MSGTPAPDPDGFDSLLALVNDASARRTRDEPAAPYDQEADGRTGDAQQATGDGRTAARRPSAGEPGGTEWPPEYGPEPPGQATPPPARSGGASLAHEAPDGGTSGQASAAAASHGQCGARRHGSAVTGWAEAVRVAGRAGQAVRERTSAVRPPLELPPAEALGLVLARPLAALTDLPPFDTSAMDGWAVAGPGPWRLRPDGVLAGQSGEALADGEAVPIATGARVPRDVTAVIRSEHGRLDAHGGLHPEREVVHGQDIRPRAQECRTGDTLLPAGSAVTPAVLGLAAAAGYDTLAVHARPTVDLFVLGDELLTRGLPRDGLIRDALGPMLPHWLREAGAEVRTVERLGDRPDALAEAVAASEADLVVTTGGTAAGPVDFVHPTLERLGADLLVDGVAVRPGHPMLLARTAPGQHLVGLPGNPLAAVCGLLTLVVPLLRGLAGAPLRQGAAAGRTPGSGAVPDVYETRRVQLSSDPLVATAPPGPDAAAPTAVLDASVQGHPSDTRLVPVRVDAGWARPLSFGGPAMLRGVATADALAVVVPGGAEAGHPVELLALPWAGGGGGFT
ncbi:molybdopterin molybdenumtransferase MoeA [Streptomyces albidoflavus]|uniref:molybdopterin molybdotransferase MoeA n=1 Tax=Streptomyces albidoflavus TaxID=1886 RepID=UPI000BAE29C4|nr:molybdopterin molybdotransferase MoeA [Streptomyces albidoflavus]PAX83762.1 molybdopterin molybdenumtransferase MoeA [Streptomyces albidoflavus]PAX89227.1 molybdopterin molybdenumtransferase MoeA [Streptomyces albidoflavus]PBO20328.1 molybdopterin molybdenumtransferase MoeA [Streptomyces albidoflavus]PBO25392.1 molybdopterin molybdenumtransferase MoeA [Streptomyces albidoflavus]PBO27167.1 molybdopterin molybdenumtransferase MoeA [Streptomyces albidoflavus]